MSRFASPSEFREVVDRALTMLGQDPEMGPRLREVGTSVRFEFTDVGLVVQLRAGGQAEPNLVWVWSSDAGWRPKVRLAMSSTTLGRYLQGRENVVVALARRRVKARGDVKSGLAVLSILPPLFPRYRAMIAEHYPHLED